MTNGCPTLVLPGDVIYDIVNQVKDVGSYKVEDNNDSFRIEFSLDYTPRDSPSCKTVFQMETSRRQAGVRENMGRHNRVQRIRHGTGV